MDLRLIIFHCIDTWNMSYKFYMTCNVNEVEDCVAQQTRLSTEIVGYEVTDHIYIYTK